MIPTRQAILSFASPHTALESQLQIKISLSLNPNLVIFFLPLFFKSSNSFFQNAAQMLSRLNSFFYSSTAFRMFTANMGLSLPICAVLIFSLLSHLEFSLKLLQCFTLPANSTRKVASLQVKTSLSRTLPGTGVLNGTEH